MKPNYKLVQLVVLLCATTIFSCKKTSNSDSIPEGKQTVVLNGDITVNTDLDSKNDYVLKGRVYVKNNVTLTIPQGTTVSVEAGSTADTKGALIVTPGSKLNINGTVDQPVVFTSGAVSKAPGDWVGIIVLGKASTNGVGGKLNVSGLPVTTDTEFGGTADDDNSGSIKYLRLEYAGGLNPSMEAEWALDQASGLSLNGVGSGTVLEHVMVKYSNDDAFQFVGGTVNGKYLVAYNNGDDNFDFDRGYRGNLQFLVSYRTVPSTVAIRANGMESLNDMDASDAMPYTRPVISNMTIIGPSANQPETDQSQGIYIRRNTRFDVQNSVIAGYSDGGLMLCPKTKPILINNLGSEFKYNLVNSDDPARAFTYDNGPTGIIITPDPVVAAWAIESDQSSIEKPSLNRNIILNQIADLKVKTLYGASGPDLTPTEGSAALTGANFDDIDFVNFTKVTFRGALGGSDTWASASAWLDWK
jgi:hypothetical protein